MASVSTNTHQTLIGESNTLVEGLSTEYEGGDLSESEKSDYEDTLSSIKKLPDEITKVSHESLKNCYRELMTISREYIEKDFNDGRIDNDSYVALTQESAKSNIDVALRFVFESENNYWTRKQIASAVQGQELDNIAKESGIREARLNAEIKFHQAETAKANAASSKLAVVQADRNIDLTCTQNDIEKYKLAQLMPLQRGIASAEKQILDHDFTHMKPLERKGLVQGLAIGEQKILESQADVHIKQFQVDHLMPKELELAESTIDKTDAEIDRINKAIEEATTDIGIKDFQLASILPQQLLNEQQQVLSLRKDVDIKDFQINEVLPVRTQVELSKISDTYILKGSTKAVSGSVKVQKDLQEQQRKSFIADSKYRAVKMLADSYTVGKNIDEGLATPYYLTMPSIDAGIKNFLNEINVTVPNKPSNYRG